MPTGQGGNLLNRRQAEREFYYRQLGSNTPLKKILQLEREYYIHYLAAASPAGAQHIPLTQLFTVWAKKFISDKGATPPPGNYPAQLWRQLVVVSGFSPLRAINDNRFIFYLNN